MPDLFNLPFVIMVTGTDPLLRDVHLRKLLRKHCSCISARTHSVFIILQMTYPALWNPCSSMEAANTSTCNDECSCGSVRILAWRVCFSDGGSISSGSISCAFFWCKNNQLWDEQTSFVLDNAFRE